MKDNITGGGLKKVLYTLKLAQKTGLRSTAKALNSRNTCKTCGLGMGGQRGGMTNELGEFPSVCNKSVQAQSTDLQPPIPLEVFNHDLHDLKELDESELAKLGRLTTPIYKAAGALGYTPVSWQEAASISAKAFRNSQPERTFFYSSGRSSNEAGFILQLLARIYGTNNVSNCSYYCHQATSEGLGQSIGHGTATVELEDLSSCDFIMLLGANPASNHPRFIYKLQACRERGGEVVIVNPAKEPGLVRFAMPKSARSLLIGGSPIATEYLQPNIGGDLALLRGIAKAVIEQDGCAKAFLAAHTDDAQVYIDAVKNTSWQEIAEACGIGCDEIQRVAQKYCQAKHAVFAWGMGITHHKHGVDNVEEIANLALLRGMIGRPYSGLLPLRGHSNVQGIGTIGVKPVLSSEVFEAIEKHFDVELPTKVGMDTMACLEAADRGEIDAALLMGGNLYSATPNSTWAKSALDRIGFTLCLTTTLNRTHLYGLDNSSALVLPVKARDEEHQATTQESMFNYIRLSDGGIHRHDGPRSEVDILIELASQLVDVAKFDFKQFHQHKSIRAAIAATVPGLEQLASIDVAKREFHVNNRILHSPVFNTTSGRARFNVNPIPTLSTNRPYTLASVRSEGQFNTIIYEQADTYRGATIRECLFINAADLASLGIKDGDLVDVHSDTGSLLGYQAILFDLPRSNVLAYFPEANILISTDRDERSKTPAFKSVSVSIVASKTAN